MEQYYEIPPANKIAFTTDGRCICHICGKAVQKLGPHVRSAHNMSAFDYKRMFNVTISEYIRVADYQVKCPKDFLIYKERNKLLREE